MNLKRLRDAGLENKRARDVADGAYSAALDVVVDELEQADADGNVTLAAKLAEVSRATVYNELGRRQERRDALAHK